MKKNGNSESASRTRSKSKSHPEAPHTNQTPRVFVKSEPKTTENTTSRFR